MRADSNIRAAMIAAHEAPNDPERRADVARAWLRAGKPELALSWAREAYRLKRSPEYAALLKGIGQFLETETEIAFPRSPAPPPQPKTEPPQPKIEPPKPKIELLKIEPRKIEARIVKGKPADTAVMRVRETWEQAPTKGIEPTTPASLESQLNALFGGDLFNEETQYGQLSVVRALRPKRKRSVVALTLLVVAFCAGLATAWTSVRTVKKSRECAAVAHDLEGFLRTGELRQADEALDRVQALAKDTERTHEFAPLMARAEATLYRYVDSSKARKKHVEELLAEVGEGTFDGVVARALISPSRRLPDLQAVLQEIASTSRDPEAAFLVGVSLAQVGKRREADKAFARAIDMEPSNLPHLAHNGRWLARSGRSGDAEEILDQMRTIDAESPWIQWLEEEIRIARPIRTAVAHEDGI